MANRKLYVVQYKRGDSEWVDEKPASRGIYVTKQTLKNKIGNYNRLVDQIKNPPSYWQGFQIERNIEQSKEWIRLNYTDVIFRVLKIELDTQTMSSMMEVIEQIEFDSKGQLID